MQCFNTKHLLSSRCPLCSGFYYNNFGSQVREGSQTKPLTQSLVNWGKGKNPFPFQGIAPTFLPQITVFCALFFRYFVQSRTNGRFVRVCTTPC